MAVGRLALGTLRSGYKNKRNYKCGLSNLVRLIGTFNTNVIAVKGSGNVIGLEFESRAYTQCCN